MRMFEGKLVFTKLEEIEKLVEYYGKDATVRDVISANICPNDQYKLRDNKRMYK